MPFLNDNDLASAQVVESAKLAAWENKARFELVSKQILEATKLLSKAEGELRAAVADGGVGVADIQEYRAKVNELMSLIELMRSK